MKLNRLRPLHVILAQRLWQAGAGLVTIVLVTRFLTLEQQGWYYSLLSLAALYTLFDLGLSYVVLQAAAHSFLHLRWTPGGHVAGHGADRFAALVAWSARHYLWLGAGFLAIAAPAGLVFFDTAGSQTVSWRLPWLVLAIASAGGLLVLPFPALVEGSGRVAEVYGVRLIQGILAAVMSWAALIAGAGLWTVVIAPLCAIAVPLAWLRLRKPALISFALQGEHREIAWRQDIWPHQWQLGLGWLCGYLTTQVYTLVLFSTQGASVAGQMGLTLTASNMLGLLAQSWITRHVPAMAQAVAARDWEQLDRLFFRDALLSCAAFFGGGVLLCILHRVLDGTAAAGRLLPFWPFAGLLLAGFSVHVQTCLAAQLRSFRREPLTGISVIGAILTVTGALWAAAHYSASGVVAVMLTTQSFVILPASILIWRTCRRRWRNSIGCDSTASDDRNPHMESIILSCADT